MARLTSVVVLSVLLAASASAVELTASTWPPVSGCGSVKVDPGYVPPIIDGQPQPDPCIVAAIPSEAQSLRWRATELWEMPPAGSPSGWTRLTCGAVRDGSDWSFSCFDAGVIEQWQGRSMAGRFAGTAAQLDVVVRAWWAAQR